MSAVTGRYAVVTSTLALIVALGGTGYAAVSIGTGQLKNNAVTSPKVKNDTLTGKDVKESTLKTVPRATKADSATKVNGATIVAVNYRSGDVTDAAVGTLNGLTVRVTCTSGGEQLSAVTSVGGGEISFSSLEPDDLAATTGDNEDDFTTSGVFAMPAPNYSDRTYRIHYSAANNKSVTAFLATEDDIGDNDCIVSGYLIG